MNAPDNDPLYAAINAKLAEIAAAAATPPAWHIAWMSLGPESDGAQRLKVYQAIRNAGALDVAGAFYLISWQIDAIVSQLAESALREIDQRLLAIKRAHGLEDDDFWPPGQTPPEYEALRRQYQQCWDKMFVDQLEACGEKQMAHEFRADPDAFHRQTEAGRQFFHGPTEADSGDAPSWIYSLVEAVAEHMTAMGAAGTIGFRYQEDDGLWQVIVYPQPVELIGGADDGEIVAPAFSLDLEGVRGIFSRLDAFSWEAIGLPDGDGPHVLLEGAYQEHEVLVQILAYAPEDEEPGMKVDTTQPEE